MLIACVQSDVSFADPQANLQRVLSWMDHADRLAGRSTSALPELLVFPECMLTGYCFDSRQQAMDVALPESSPIFASIADAAQRRQCHVSVGFLEQSGQQLFNAAALIGPTGIVSIYRKIHLPHLGVDRFVDRGDRPYGAVAVNCESGPVKIGLAICYDASFPEPMRVLGLDGAEIIALGTNWPVEATRTPELVPPARSMENHLYFVAANRVGTENGFAFSGRSSICGPDGVVLASSDDDQEALLLADVDLQSARDKSIERTKGSHRINRFDDRCPQFYGAIVE